MANRRTFLNVENSANQRRWVERLSAPQANIALNIAQTRDVPDILARVLAARGVLSEQVEQFLNPTLRELMTDPRSMTDAQKAAIAVACDCPASRRCPEWFSCPLANQKLTYADLSWLWRPVLLPTAIVQNGGRLRL